MYISWPGWSSACEPNVAGRSSQWKHIGCTASLLARILLFTEHCVPIYLVQCARGDRFRLDGRNKHLVPQRTYLRQLCGYRDHPLRPPRSRSSSSRRTARVAVSRRIRNGDQHEQAIKDDCIMYVQKCFVGGMDGMDVKFGWLLRKVHGYACLGQSGV